MTVYVAGLSPAGRICVTVVPDVVGAGTLSGPPLALTRTVL